MTRDVFDHQLRHIQDEIFVLGSMVENAMIASMEALRQRDIKASKKIYGDDQNINDKRFAIENAILILIATQQPIAHDLRILTAILEVNIELERMGDYAKGIAKINMMLGHSDFDAPLRNLTTMADLGINMLDRSLSAFVREDVSVASAIPLEDDQIDNLFKKIYQDLVNAIIDKPSIVDDANHYIWVAHNLERFADRVTNICERTVFVCTGELLEYDTMDEDELEDDES
jgi:phosphate transport system protein